MVGVLDAIIGSRAAKHKKLTLKRRGIVYNGWLRVDPDQAYPDQTSRPDIQGCVNNRAEVYIGIAPGGAFYHVGNIVLDQVEGIVQFNYSEVWPVVFGRHWPRHWRLFNLTDPDSLDELWSFVELRAMWHLVANKWRHSRSWRRHMRDLENQRLVSSEEIAGV